MNSFNSICFFCCSVRVVSSSFATFLHRRTPTSYLLRPLRSIQSKPVSIVTPDDVADLILRSKSPNNSLSIYQWASTIPSFHHTPTTQLALVRSLVYFRWFDDARRFILTLPTPPSDDLLLPLIRGLGRARRTQEAIKVLSLVTNPSLKIWNSVLDVLVEDDIDIARSFYRKKMASSGVSGDERTFGILMKGLCRANRIDEGFKLLKLAKRKGFGSNPVIWNTLVHALCRNEKVGRARSLMELMEKPSDVTFNIMISAYCAERDVLKALVMAEKCFHSGFVPDVVSITKVIDLMCEEGRVVEAMEMLERVERTSGEKLDVVCYNTLINGFCKIGKVKVGRRIMKEMELDGRVLPDTRTYNILISANCISGDVDSVIDLFQEMKGAGVNTDFTTFNVMIRGLCFAGRVEEGFKFLGLMEENGGGEVDRIEPYNSVIYGLYKIGRFQEAHAFLGRLRFSFPRVVRSSLMVLGLCYHSQILDAKKVYDEMIVRGDVPSVLVYACLIHGLCREGGVGLIQEAFDVMNGMIAGRNWPEASIFNALIDGLCREGKVGSARELLEEMAGRGYSPDADSYDYVICGFCRDCNMGKACSLLADMLGKGLVPKCSTWNALVLCLIQEIQDVSIDDIIHSGAELHAFFLLPNLDSSSLLQNDKQI